MSTAAVETHPRPSIRALAARFFGYLSADGLNYALGFVIYAWLVRILSNQQYGVLSIATSVYQPLMMIAALGLDLTGPKLLAEFAGDPMLFARRVQNLRLTMALLVCGPVELGAAWFAWHKGESVLALVLLASFTMILSRAVDLTYLAVALRKPLPLARTRAVGLMAYLVLLILCTSIVRQHLWLVPALNAAGVTLGRVQLWKLLRRRIPHPQSGRTISYRQIATQGFKAGGGQLLLLVMQTADVILLARYVTADAVGQYAMISRLYLLGTAVLGAMLNTFMPEIVRVSQDAKELRHQFRNLILVNLLLGILGWACFLGAGGWVSEVLARRTLPFVRSIIPAFALAFLLMATANSFLSMLPSLHRATEYVVGIASAVALLLGVDLALMPRYGVVGAAYGQVLATAFLAAFSAVVYFRHLRTIPEAAEAMVANTWQD